MITLYTSTNRFHWSPKLYRWRNKKDTYTEVSFMWLRYALVYSSGEL